MTSHIKAIGVDPGLASTGFAVVEILERGGRACHWGDITTSPKLTFSERLDSIYYQLSEVISCWHPQLLVMEDVFVYKKYPKAAIQLGTVKGVVYLAAQHKKINVCEIKPTELKSALTWYFPLVKLLFGLQIVKTGHEVAGCVFKPTTRNA